MSDSYDELERQHQGWLEKPGTSRGQIEDSRAILALISRLRKLEAVAQAARELIDPDECELDHNRFCQTHYSSAPCVQRAARDALERLDREENP